MDPACAGISLGDVLFLFEGVWIWGGAGFARNRFAYEIGLPKGEKVKYDLTRFTGR
jgi:hypothetical protein